MSQIGHRRAEIFLILEEIMANCHVVVTAIANLWMTNCSGRRIREHRSRYLLTARIEGQLEHMDSLITHYDVDCLDQLRMPRASFARLCFLLKNIGGLKESRHVSVNEKVALFLSVISHHKKNRVVKFDFKRSGQTVSKYFHSVLIAVLKLHPILLVTPEPVEEGCEISNWRHFKGCLGALDGTYVKVTVPEAHKPRYRTRKGDIAVNVLGVCDRNMRFIYVLSGWEGSAADCRVLRDAVSRPNGFKIPQGNYYLADNGYTNADGFITPYRGVRYHLDEWGAGSRAPQNQREFFNMVHAKARNVIERTFGLLKKRWAVLRSPSFYALKTQNRIIMACGLLHNFLRNELPEDPLEDELEEVESLHEEGEHRNFIDSVEPSPEWSAWRDNIAQMIFDEWMERRYP